jgi:hypothetical protein
VNAVNRTRDCVAPIKRIAANHDLHLIAVRHKAKAVNDVPPALAREELLKHCRSVRIVDLSARTHPMALLWQAAASLGRQEPMWAA